jgi:hypothetical protein
VFFLYEKYRRDEKKYKLTVLKFTEKKEGISSVKHLFSAALCGFPSHGPKREPPFFGGSVVKIRGFGLQ